MRYRKMTQHLVEAVVIMQVERENIIVMKQRK